MNKILVVISEYNSRPTLQRAVDSLLNQTFKDFDILIISDCSTTPAKEYIKPNDRIKFFELKKNMGRYFCDSVAVKASPYEYYLPHDADDVSAPLRMAYLVDRMNKKEVDAIFHHQVVIARNGQRRAETFGGINKPLNQKMLHRAHWSGLYKTQALRNVGGIHPDFRVGYDTLLVNLLKMRGEVMLMPRFLYTRYIQDTSLTVSEKTGFGSPYRRRQVVKLNKLYADCFNSPDRIKYIIEKSISPTTKLQLNKESNRLKKEMSW